MHLTRDTTHTVWDNSLEPVASAAPGQTVVIEVANSSGGQITADSTVEAVRRLDFGRVNPVTGPLQVQGAEPGDAVTVDIVDIEVDDWGWTASIPGFGLLADQFPDAHLRISAIIAGHAHLLPSVAVPVVAMIGTIGLAPAAPGEHPMVPPHRQGGNMDIRHVGVGARLLLPVAVPGALLSVGDTHAAQGDGEVCGTGVETSSVVTVRVGLEKNRRIPTPLLESDPRSARPGRALVTTGIGPDLLTAARDATSYLIEEVVRRTGLEHVDAYLLASVAADMHVSEIVDQPNVVVSMHLDLDLVGGGA